MSRDDVEGRQAVEKEGLAEHQTAVAARLEENHRQKIAGQARPDEGLLRQHEAENSELRAQQERERAVMQARHKRECRR